MHKGHSTVAGLEALGAMGEQPPKKVPRVFDSSLNVSGQEQYENFEFSEVPVPRGGAGKTVHS